MSLTKKQLIYLNSAHFKEARMRGLRNAWAKQANGPKCGAKTRADGAPCRNPVAEEGQRCRLHGGATPKGKDWHRRQFPKKGASISKLQKKLSELSKRDQKAEERRAAMSPEERAMHEKRRRANRPGTPSERQQARDGRKAMKLVQGLLQHKNAISDEVSALDAQIRTLEDRANQLQLDQYDEDELPEVFK